MKIFPFLFAQGRKYGFATSIAHQDREQFWDNKLMRGATDAAGSKVYFRLSVKDGNEQSPEFAKPPPTETRRERELVISQEPVTDLLRGHANGQVREFVNKYMRVLSERQEDTRADMERIRLERQEEMDDAGLHRIDAMFEGTRDREREIFA